MGLGGDYMFGDLFSVSQKERRHGCDQRKKEWRKSEEEWEAKTSERKSGHWWNDQCGDGMRKLHEDLPATTMWEAEFL